MRDERHGAVLSASDDSFHPPVTDDPFWTETSWYTFSVPDRRLSGLIYPVFRANLGMCAAGVYVWDDSGTHLHDIRYGAVQYYLPMPTDDLTNLRLGLGDGLEFETIEPLRKYRVGYRDADFAIDLNVHGLHEPYAMRRGGEGHLEQVCRVTGRLRLDGEDIAINRVVLRDRSWSVRSDTAALRGSFTYGINERGEVLQVSTVVDGSNVTGGWRLLNNEMVGIVEGTRTVERNENRPVRIVLDVVDELGNHVHATGDCVNSFIWQTTARIFAWMSLVRWTIDGEEAWGEDQDAWSLDQLQLAVREERTGPR